jgi:hypothetical protein
MTTYLGLALALFAGCSSFDDDVFPDVATATLTAVPSAPSGLAAIDITLRIVAGPSADRVVSLDLVRIEHVDDRSHALDLDVVLPGNATRSLGPNDVVSAELVNVGTTNVELAPLCGETFYFQVFLAYPDSPGETTGGSGAPVTIGCS